MSNLLTLRRSLAHMKRRRFLALVIAPCLLLTSGASALNAQSCTMPVSPSSSCDCGATINFGVCGYCYSIAIAEALGCALAGTCTLDTVYEHLNECLAGMTPPPPP